MNDYFWYEDSPAWDIAKNFLTSRKILWPHQSICTTYRGKLKKHKLLFRVDTKPWIYDVMLQLINIIFELLTSSMNDSFWSFTLQTPKMVQHTQFISFCWRYVECVWEFLWRLALKGLKQTFWMKNFAWTFCLMAQWVR